MSLIWSPKTCRASSVSIPVCVEKKWKLGNFALLAAIHIHHHASLQFIVNRDAISVASHTSQRWDPSNIPKASPKWSNFCIDIRFEVLTNKFKEHSGIQKVSKKNPAEISIHPGWWMTSIARTSYKSCLSRCRNDIRWVMVMTHK